MNKIFLNKTEEKNMFLTWNSFIGQFVHPVRGEGCDKKDHGEYRYFSLLQVSLY